MKYPCLVLHVKEGYEEREKSIAEQFAKLSIPVRWILDFDVAELGNEVLEKYGFYGSLLRDSEISCCLKHISAWEKIASGPDQAGFVFEDDVLIDRERFIKIAEQAIAEFHNSGKEEGCLCFGDGCAMYVPWTKLEKNRRLYQAEQVRAADSYWLTKKTAGRMLDWLAANGFSLPADHLITKIANELGIPIYWVEPTVVSQGSHTGRFSSMLKEKDRGELKEKVNWIVKKLRRKYLYPLTGVDPRKMTPGFRKKLDIDGNRKK